MGDGARGKVWEVQRASRDWSEMAGGVVRGMVVEFVHARVGTAKGLWKRFVG